MIPRLTLDGLTQENVELIAKMEADSNSSRTLGERLADRIATVVGSWMFLIIQSVMLIIWMTLNVMGWWNRWDPYPFVLLNLVLSFQAAFATPVILMSQNRQGWLSERRNQLDLQINLLAEQENTKQLHLLRLVCEKLEIEIDDSREQILEEQTSPDEIVSQITEILEGAGTENANEIPSAVKRSRSTDTRNAKDLN